MYCLTQSPQTFISISENPIPQALRYGVAKRRVLAAWIFYLYKHFCTEPHISSCQGALYRMLGFCIFDVYSTLAIFHSQGRGLGPKDF